MASPTSRNGKRYSTDSADTTFSGIFDDDSPLSSSVSPISQSPDSESEYEEGTPSKASKTGEDVEPFGSIIDPHLYSSAAFWRPRRSQSSAPDSFTPDSYYDVQKKLGQTGSDAGSEQTSGTSADEDTPEALQAPSRKRKQPTAVPEVLETSKKVKAGTKRNKHRFKIKEFSTATGNELGPTVPARQPPKLKAPGTSSDLLSQPSLQISKGASTETVAQSTPQQASASTEIQVRRSGRQVTKTERPDAALLTPKPRSSTKKQAIRKLGSPLTRKTPARKTAIVQLKIPAAELGRALAGLGEELPTSFFQDFQPIDASVSQVNPTPTCGFQKTSSVESQNDIHQCAQRALSPIPTSSQGLTSSSGSQSVQTPHQPQEPNTALPGIEEEPAEYDLDVLPQTPFNEPQWVPSPPIAIANKTQLKSRDTASQASYLTQPTQLLDLPWKAPLASPLAPILFMNTVAQDVTDTESVATTVDEAELETNHTDSQSAEHVQLRQIADQLFAHRSINVTKPNPIGQPEVWADGRQELCETLHYFRSYQSACYSTGGFVRAFMFDKVAHARDYMDSDVVISRAGGGLVKDKESGEMRSSKDQTDDTSTVQALKNCMKHYNPLVIITGVDNPHIPSQPPHQYCVLDYFKPTHMWVEKSGRSKILRYRFEKLNTRNKSWWRPKDGRDPIELGSLAPPVQECCKACGEVSQQIYLNDWMCLQPACTAFWKVVNGIYFGAQATSYEPEESSLVYDPRFLKQKIPWPNDDHDYSLVSNTPELSRYSIPGEDTSQAFWSGIVCPDCGRCNSRLSWMGWDCLNPQCNFKRQPPHSLIPATSLREPFWPLTDSYTLSRDIHASVIDVNVSFAHGYRINRYSFPGLDGFITHMIANKTVVEEPGGPDAMFEELQQTDIDLRRRAMPNGQLKGESYCRHFTVNYGMPYKFIAATASHSFDCAARPITATRSRLNWAAKHLLTRETGKTMAEVSESWQPKEFNEVLALGYFEQQKINYHDDGEHGLGPTIATLSLGAPGTMKIRMKARHYNGTSTAGVYDDARPLPGCAQYEARAALQPELDALKLSNTKAYRACLKQIPKDLKLKASGNAKEVLKIELGHGDIVFMHGAELQKYYEHAVEHGGKLRFALTCRYIDPESLKEGDKPGYVVGPDEGGYDGSLLG